MLTVIFGESCSGKTTYVEQGDFSNASIYQGKDYLRLDKNPVQAEIQFMDILKDALVSEAQVVYVLTEKDHLKFVPDGALRIYIKADLETIKNRFAKRIGANVLPKGIELMLERKHGIFDDVIYDECIVSE